MPIDFIPSPPVALALLAVGLMPVYLIALSHGPWTVAAPGRRFLVAAGTAWLTWVMLVIASRAADVVGVVAGGLLLATATLAGFTLWTLVAWGFTLTMLLMLARAGRPLTEAEWILAYTRGKPLSVFARDRLGVLFKLGLAESRGDRVVMTPRRGRLFARATGLLRGLFGLPA